MTVTEPRAGTLARPDGVKIAWDLSGSPKGLPAVVLHGGPGSGRSNTARRLFDLDLWSVLSFDQRGCGASTPHLAEDPAALDLITLSAMIDDIEALRAHTGLSRWLVYGGSWGSTLALAYAARHPDRVAALVLGPVTMTRRAEVDFALRGLGRTNPAAWDALCAAVPEASASLDDPDASFKILNALDKRLAEPRTADDAATAWAACEVALAGGERHSRWDDRRFRLAFARLVVRVWSRCAWLDDTALLKVAATFDQRDPALEGSLVHAAVDISATRTVAEELASGWTGARLVILPGAAHSLANADLFEALRAEIARFGDRPDLF